MEGIRLIGRPSSEAAVELVAHLERLGLDVRFMLSGDVGSTDLGFFPDTQRGGDALVTCALFGRPNARDSSSLGGKRAPCWDRVLKAPARP